MGVVKGLIKKVGKVALTVCLVASTALASIGIAGVLAFSGKAKASESSMDNTNQDAQGLLARIAKIRSDIEALEKKYSTKENENLSASENVEEKADENQDEVEAEL